MEKIIYCCDICRKEILNYSREKDSISLEVREVGPQGITPSESRDICLHCLATTVVLEHKVAGMAPSRELIELIDKRAKEVQK